MRGSCEGLSLWKIIFALRIGQLRESYSNRGWRSVVYLICAAIGGREEGLWMRRAIKHELAEANVSAMRDACDAIRSRGINE